MNLIPIAKKYFLHFENKDIKSLKLLFGSDVKLRDWEINVQGFDNVVMQNIKIFENLDNFKLKIIDLTQSENIIFAEIEIILANNEILKVLDKITFNQDLKISEIKAFRG